MDSLIADARYLAQRLDKLMSKNAASCQHFGELHDACLYPRQVDVMGEGNLSKCTFEVEPKLSQGKRIISTDKASTCEIPRGKMLSSLSLWNSDTNRRMNHR